MTSEAFKDPVLSVYELLKWSSTKRSSSDLYLGGKNVSLGMGILQ